MKTSNYIEVAKQFIRKAFSNKGLSVLFCIYFLLLGLAAVNGWTHYHDRHDTVHHHQDISRESWDNNPDKHPHRMAHYGSFVFRKQHPLSMFDSGLENYTGNVIFLEAHKQNTANFSEASLSTGLVRIGDLNIAMILQFLIPLIIFFIGYSAISGEKENGILRIMYALGMSLRKILFGKFLGLFAIAALFFIPALLLMWSTILVEDGSSDLILRVALMSNSYLLYFIIICLITVLVSAYSRSSTRSLLVLLCGWLLLCVIMPKLGQTMGNMLYPNSSKIEFRSKVESELTKRGDSHNPDDPYFNNLRDSLLQAYNVENVTDLPINYNGFIMSKGEQQTSIIYKEEQSDLTETYLKQNGVNNKLSLINPFLAVSSISKSLSGTDFVNYTTFLDQVEKYRYDQSQFLNNLQINLISNKATSSEGKVNVVSKDYWKEVPEFVYESPSAITVIKTQCHSMLSLFLWIAVGIFAMLKFNNSAYILE